DDINVFVDEDEDGDNVQMYLEKNNDNDEDDDDGGDGDNHLTTSKNSKLKSFARHIGRTYESFEEGTTFHFTVSQNDETNVIKEQTNTP
ncbi:MAG: hypothetical protein IKP58_12235, partial [Victivallales bacterium]|nr:hypothetical protein [Victivallales bacterium]